MPSFLLMLLLVLLTACSNSKNSTPVGFKLTLSSITTGLGADGEGGFVIYGKSSTGAAFGKVITTAAAPTMVVPNGTWTFYGLAWDGGGAGTDELKAMRGQVRCANSGEVVLDGSAKSINLTLSNDTCNTDSFTDTTNLPMQATTPKKFATIQTVFCKSLDTAVVDTTTPGANCEYDLSTFTARKTAKGYGTGVKFALRSFNQPAGGAIQWLSEKITSNCVEMPDGSTGILPTDSGGNTFDFPTKTVFPFALIAEIYYGTNPSTPCDDTYGKGEIVIPNGPLSVSTLGGVERVKSVQFDAITVKTFLRVGENMACADTKPASQFAGGFGSANVPYYICNNDQLNLIRGSNYTGVPATKNYILLKNINHWTGLDPNGSGFADQEPIGEVVSGASANSSIPFTGSFNGNNKQVIGWSYRVNEAEAKEIGFFRNIGTNGKVFDLELIRAEIDKDYSDRVDNVGVLVGASAGLIDNVTVRHADIRGSVNVGGIAGRVDSTGRISNSKVYKTEIQATRYAGGIVGELAANGGGSYVVRSGVYDILIEGDSFNNSNCADLTISQTSCTGGTLEWRSGYCIDPVTYTTEQSCPIATHAWLQPYGFGGIAGKVSFTSGSAAIIGSRADGLIIAHSTVGGLVGFMNNNGPIIDSYANTSIEATTTSNIAGFKKRSGGLVGHYNSGGPHTLTRVYFDKGGMLHDSTLESNPIQGYGIAGNLANIFASVTASTATSGNALNLGGTAQNGADMWADATFDSSWDTDWIHNDVGFSAPRLAWEKPEDHPCEGKRSGAPTGSGTSASPYLICTQAQFLAINGSSSFYKLGDSIDLRSVNGSANAVVAFPGTLDGNYKALTNYSNTSFSGAAIFGTINGPSTVKNLFVTGTNINTTNLMAGSLAKFNNGIIDNVETHGTVKARAFVGGIVAQNNNAILRSISFTNIANNTSGMSWSHIGGIAGNNQGIIGLSESSSNITLTSAASADGNKIGGIAGNNEQLGSPSVEVNPGETVTGGGIIFETQFSGQFITSGSLPINNIGGITGSNSAGTAKVINSLAEFDIKDTTFDGSFSTLNNIAGIVAEGVTGTETSYSWARFSGNFSNDLTGSNFYFTAPNDSGSRLGLKYMDQLTSQYDPLFSNGGDGANTIKLFTDSNTPDASDITQYVGWDITDDDENETAVWKLHSGDTFGPRLNREGGEDEFLEVFNQYKNVTP